MHGIRSKAVYALANGRKGKLFMVNYTDVERYV